MGRSLDLRHPGPSSLTPLSRGHHVSATPHRRPPRTAPLLYGSTALLILQAVGAASAGGGQAAASAALFLTTFASTIDPSRQLTCYTCVNVTDNDVCNRYAIDRPCPEDKQFCHSLHVLEGFGSKGSSLVVNKGCAGEDECNRGSVGCRREGGQTTCNACCDTEYCNARAPVDAETASYVRTRSLGVRFPIPPHLPVLLLPTFGPCILVVLDSIRGFIAETMFHEWRS